jgi:hypothetical protein
MELKLNCKELIKQRLEFKKYQNKPIDVDFRCSHCEVSWIVSMRTIDRDQCPICDRWINPRKLLLDSTYQKVKFTKFLSQSFVDELVVKANRQIQTNTYKLNQKEK